MAKIKIEKSLHDRLAETAQRAGYATVDEFITHVLEQAVSHLEQAADDDEVQKQLRGLGYIE